MLILPVPRAPDWRRPPIMTLLLIALCTLIFFGVQGQDQAREKAAWVYYLQSSLPQIEQPLYHDWLERSGGLGRIPAAEDLNTVSGRVAFARQIQNDAAFLAELKHGQLRPQQEGWAVQRLTFEQKLQAPVSTRYAFSPAEPRAITWLSHMFLHASEDHLLGNMIVLFIVGYLVEEVLGAGLFLLFYVLAGVGAAGFDLLLNASRIEGGIGASGAIAGVMALYVSLFRLQRIRFFYWILVYADFFMAPALLILPVWIGNEAWQMWAHPDSHVNYAAHMGGFISGGLLAGIWLLLRRKTLPAMPLAEATASAEEELAPIQPLINTLQLERALPQLQDLARRHPQHLKVLGRYYHVSKLMPGTPQLHEAAALLLAVPDSGSHDCRSLLREYLQLCKNQAQLPPALLADLARRLLRAGHVEEGDWLVRALTVAAPAHHALPALMLQQARWSHQCGDQRGLAVKLQALRSAFPESEEAAMSQHLG